MDSTIQSFLEKSSTATVCCTGDEHPACFSCFFSICMDDVCLIFKSSPNSTHIQLMKSNPAVAGTILPDKLHKLQIRGIQFEGNLLQLPVSDVQQQHYYKKHPLAIAVPGEFYVIQLNKIKMTASNFGIIKKSKWERLHDEVK